MNKEWSELNKEVQIQLKKEATFSQGIETLLKLRQKLFDELVCLKQELRREEFDAMPFVNAKGYHSKTIAYSIWHIFRIEDIKESTEEILKNFSFKELKRKFEDIDKENLKDLKVVSTDENACWLIDYWCGKDIRGLIQMPFSRHWIMHIEASLRIEKKIIQIRDMGEWKGNTL